MHDAIPRQGDLPDYSAHFNDSLLSSYNPFAEDEKEPLPYAESWEDGIEEAAGLDQGLEPPPQPKAQLSRALTRVGHSRSRRHFSISKSGREKPGQKYHKQPTSGRRPRIFVNTNVGRHRAKASTDQRHDQKAGTGTRQDQDCYARFVSLENLKAVDAAAAAAAVVAPQQNHRMYQHMQPRPRAVLPSGYAGSFAERVNPGQPVPLPASGARTQIGRPSPSNGLPSNSDGVGAEAKRLDPAAAAAGGLSRGGAGLRRETYSQSLSPNASPANPNGAVNLRESLSPYDRAITIGLSMDHEHVADEPDRQPVSPETVIDDSEEVRDSPDAQPVLTPTILITPAKDFRGPFAQVAARNVRARPPVASSVYSSRVSQWLEGALGAASPPAVQSPGSSLRSPSVWPASSASNVKRDSAATVFEEDELPANRNLRQSTNTVFEGEEWPALSPESSSPGHVDRQRAHPPPLQIDTSRHASHGWWNVITTPFLTRSNTNVSRRVSTDLDRPEMPDLALATAIAARYEQANRHDEANPVSPASWESALPTSSTPRTAWTDLSRWEETRTTEKPPVVAETRVAARKKGALISFTNEKRGQQPASRLGRDGEEGRRGGERNITGGHDGRGQGDWTFMRDHQIQPNPFQPSPSEQSPDQPTPIELRAHPTLSPSDREIPLVLTALMQNALASTDVKPAVATEGVRAGLAQRPSVPRAETDESTAAGFRSPTVHQANVAAVIRAGDPVNPVAMTLLARPNEDGMTRTEHVAPSYDPPPYSPPRVRRAPERNGRPLPTTLSAGVPAPRSFQNHGLPPRVALAPAMQHGPRRPALGTSQWSWGRPSGDVPEGLPPRPNLAPVTFGDLESRSAAGQESEAKRKRGEHEDAFARRLGALPRRLGLSKVNGCFGRRGAQARKRRRWCCGLVVGGIALLVLVVVLAVTLTRKGSDAAEEPSRWVNVTGWPPMPTGVYAVVRPELETTNTGCVFPSTLWSCALPRESREPMPEGTTSRPTFSFKIDFLQPQEPNSAATRRRSLNARSLRPRAALERRAEEGENSSNVSFSAFPDPPSLEDLQFVGNTTDGIVSDRKEGESSPFSLSLLSDSGISPSRLARRQAGSSSTNDSNSFPDLRSTIPPPDVDSDGGAKAANLLPRQASQQLRLFDRGLDSEHYGFYVYYDRSIFLKSTVLLGRDDRERGEVPDDLDGGSTIEAARVRCTWAQTRFLVQIWTRRDDQTLLERNSNSSSSSSSSAGQPASAKLDFPYPITITTDRHGGDVTKKMIYCYGVDDRRKIVPEEARIQIENRGFGGQLIGGGQGPLGKDRVTVAQGGLGGIDGGTGGCACRWKNFAQRS